MAFFPLIRLNKRPDTVYAIRNKVEAIIKALNSLWQNALLSVGLVIFMAGAFIPANAQAIVLNSREVLPELNADGSDATIFYINGGQTHGLTFSEGERHVYAPPSATKLILSLLTLRMVDNGVINLDASVSTYLPDIVPANPFEAPITIRHLLQETAGFASPPLAIPSQPLDAPVSAEKLKRFAIKLRSAGQASSHDPVGWAILVTLLEQISGGAVPQLVFDHVAAPLGLAENSIASGYQGLGGSAMPIAATMSLASFADIVRPLIRNRDSAGNLFLSRDTYASLVDGMDGFKLHPNSPTASNGIAIEQKSTFRLIMGLNTNCSNQLAFAAFPTQGIAVVSEQSKPAVCVPGLLRRTSLTLARKYFPPNSESEATPNTAKPQLARPSKLEGRYILADRSPASLAERLAVMKKEWLSVYGYSGEKLLLGIRGETPVVYSETGPYEYQSADHAGEASVLFFSPYRLGGYLVLQNASGEDRLYRRVDSLGRTGPLSGLMPWALLLIASAGLYAFAPRTKPWRNMGLFAVAGAALVGTSLYFEINSWVTVLYEQDQPLLITLWRTSLNIGLMLLLALPMFVFSFARNKTIPTTGWAALTGLHLALIAASALAVFLTLVMWGVAGTFAPY